MPDNNLKQYLLITLDPVHIGTGGYRLGRVDNSIAREPGTKLPKIPGTSLNGAIRTYAAYAYEKVSCAGQGGHCGKETCPICYTFGSVSSGGDNQHARAGTINIFDAQILFFPVWSMMGPIWITTKHVLERFGWGNSNIPQLDDDQFTSTFQRNAALNFGWLMLEPEKKDGNVSITPNHGSGVVEYEVIKDRIAIVSDHIFSRIVNDNLEVRTSVSINPETGTAKSGALFTYEAIPRSTFLMMEVVMDDFSNNFPKTKNKAKLKNSNNNKKEYEDNAGDELSAKWESPINVFETGLSNIEMLGVGGMGTRGFGRVRWVKSGSQTSSQTQKVQEKSENG